MTTLEAFCEDMDDCNGEIKDRESFLRSRDYIGLPAVAQDALYTEYLNK